MSPSLLLALWFPASVVFVFVAIQCGFWLARFRSRREPGTQDGEGPIGSVVGSVLALLAFLLAFTFDIASSRFDQRKQLVMDESDAIEAAYLRADLLPDPQRNEAKEILRAYTAQRAGLTQDPEVIRRVVADSDKLQARLWDVAREAARGDAPQALVALFIGSVNLIIDLHSDRVTLGLQYRIPPVIWWCLAAVTFLAMAGVGYQFGLAGRENVWVQALLALSFSAVIWLIANLDQPWGVLTVSQQPIIELAEKIAVPR